MITDNSNDDLPSGNNAHSTGNKVAGRSAPSRHSELINDTPRFVEKRRYIRRVAADRRIELRFGNDERRGANYGRRSAEQNWLSRK